MPQPPLRRKHKLRERKTPAATPAVEVTITPSSFASTPPPRNNSPKTKWSVLYATGPFQTPDVYFQDFKSTQDWNEAWEREIALTYRPETPSFVWSDKKRQECLEFLDERAFASRHRGRETLIRGLLRLALALGDSEDSFDKLWSSLDQRERESLLLQALEAGAERDLNIPEECLREKVETNRIVAPEVTLENLCGGNGGGVSRLVSALLGVVSASDGYPFAIVRHAEFERIYGLGGGSSLGPPPRELRAWQEEVMLVRHSYLLQLSVRVLQLLRGEKMTTFAAVGTFAGDDNPSNNPWALANTKQYGPVRDDESLASLSDACTLCFKRDAGGKSLPHCSRCKKINRITPYCSTDCQVKHFAQHKKSCGKLLSEVDSVPTYSQYDLDKFSFNTSYALRIKLAVIERHDNCIWAIFVESGAQKGTHYFTVYDSSDDELSEHQESPRKLEIENRDRAVRTKDPLAIGRLVNVCLSHGNFLEDGTDYEEIVRSQFKLEFELSDVEFDAALELASKNKQEWRQQMELDTVIRMQEDARRKDLLARGSPNATEEEKDRAFEEVLKSVDMWDMDDAKLEEQD